MRKNKSKRPHPAARPSKRPLNVPPSAAQTPDVTDSEHGLDRLGILSRQWVGNFRDGVIQTKATVPTVRRHSSWADLGVRDLIEDIAEDAVERCRRVIMLPEDDAGAPVRCAVPAPEEGHPSL